MIRNVEYGDRKKHQRTYLDGLKRYKNKGVRITIDGVECPEKEWEKIFEMGEDGGFYMGDYVGAEQGCLKEIRFDKVYLSDPPKEKKIRIHKQAIKSDNKSPDYAAAMSTVSACAAKARRRIPGFCACFLHNDCKL